MPATIEEYTGKLHGPDDPGRKSPWLEVDLFLPPFSPWTKYVGNNREGNKPTFKDNQELSKQLEKLKKMALRKTRQSSATAMSVWAEDLQYLALLKADTENKGLLIME